jgi:hypothetical protein
LLKYDATRTAFDAANAGLPEDVFKPISTPAVIDGPLSHTRNNSDFAPSNILPGLAIWNEIRANTPGLYVTGGAMSDPTISRTRW